LDFDWYKLIEELVSNDSDKANLTRIRHPHTLMHWLQTFRCSNNFPNPYHLCKNHFWRCKLPSIFQNNPELHQSFLEYACSNLDALSGEMLHTYMFNTALPALAQKIQITKQELHMVRDLLHGNNLKTLNPRTICRWLEALGFSYSPTKKTYYVDSHEKPENVKYRGQFIPCYESYKLWTH
jgi:hypothetical protein